MDSGIEPGKMFVGGLSWETTKENLVKYFEKFGELEVDNCVIMKDSESGRPRGFGFVKFKDPQSVEVTLRSGPHVLDKKTIDPKQATAKGASVGSSMGGTPTISKKVFVGGLPQVEEETVKEVFVQFGNVTDVDLKRDKATNRMRGFGFVAFETEESARNAASVHFVYVAEKKVEVKLALPRDKNFQQASGTFYSATPSVPQYQAYGYPHGYYPQTPQQPQYSGTASGQYGGFPTGYAQNSQQYAGGYATQRYPTTYEYPSTAQQHSYPQDTNSYGAVNPGSYPAEAYSSATGYGYTPDQVNSYYEQSAGVASTAGYPRAAQTQQRGTAGGVYNNYGGAR